MPTIFHIDFNSYFATVEQQANPRLRGHPVGVTGGDRQKRTVVCAASIEAKKFGVKTGMQIWEAKQLCPDIILVPGDSDKYLSVTTKFLNILKDYSPNIEVFSIDEVFMEISPSVIASERRELALNGVKGGNLYSERNQDSYDPLKAGLGMTWIAKVIKQRIKDEIGDWMKVSIGISYNKLMAKLASNLQKPDGLVVIPNQEEAVKILDKVSLDELCGIGSRIKKRLSKMGVFNFKQLRTLPLEILLLEFKSYGRFLYDAARGIDDRKLVPFYEKEEVKSVGHRHTIDHDTNDEIEIKQIFLKLTELIARKLRSKKLVGKTVSVWFRYALDGHSEERSDVGIFIQWESRLPHPKSTSPAKGGVARFARNDNGVGYHVFKGDSMQTTIPFTNDGLEIFKAAWKVFNQLWFNPSTGLGDKIRMVGVSVSNLKTTTPQNFTFFEETKKQETIIRAIDIINNKYGEFTLQRGILLDSTKIRRMPNSFLADRRFKI